MTMKFTTIALATVFALSGTFALAQGTGTAGGLDQHPERHFPGYER